MINAIILILYITGFLCFFIVAGILVTVFDWIKAKLTKGDNIL